MNIPGYDQWRLAGPEDDAPEMAECDACDGDGYVEGYLGNNVECGGCGGSGEVPVPHDEPDGDYLRDLRDDR